MHSQKVIVVNQKGLHARAAAKLAKIATQFDAKVKVTNKGQTACAKDILDLLTLGASQGTELTIETYGGDDAKNALDSAVQLFKCGFEEGQSFCSLNKETVS